MKVKAGDKVQVKNIIDMGLLSENFRVMEALEERGLLHEEFLYVILVDSDGDFFIGDTLNDNLVQGGDYREQLLELMFNSGNNVVVPKAEMEVIFEPYEPYAA